ncbi:hypothetical protein KFE25_012686 [Diacronema lutheri]|uniref:SnoaL-like domain-containing protein n=2 Tax=Diacronema lutheri TaxID=2081491 RepID=A0A8J5WZE2_DIALT|nr:hypothetical protein KFE25_012686 [Diacronema lutheri]
MFPSTRQSSFNASASAWDAIHRDDAPALALADFDPRATRGGEQTALHYACEHDAHRCAAWLVKQQGVDVDVQDAQLRTPFLLACENRAYKTIAILARTDGVDLRAASKQERTALHMLASSDEALPTIGMLLDLGLDGGAVSSDGLTPLHVAVGHDAIGAATLLLDRGFSVWKTGAGRRATPLVPFALSKGAHACAALLVERGAPLGALDTEGRSVAHLAVREGAPCLPAILARAAELDLDARDRAGRAALHYAVATGSAERAALLLQHGAEIDAEDGAGMTALHVACCTGEAEAAALLLGKGARVGAADRVGNTPLHWACQRGSEACARLLLDHGADADCANAAGLSPVALTHDPALAALFTARADGTEAHARAGERGKRSAGAPDEPGAAGGKRARAGTAGAAVAAGGAAGAPPACVDGFVKAFNAGSVDAMAELFAPAGSLDDGAGSVAVGKEAVLAKLREVIGGAGARFAVNARHYSTATATAAIEGRLSRGKGAATRGSTAKDTVVLVTADADGLIAKAKIYSVEPL